MECCLLCYYLLEPRGRQDDFEQALSSDYDTICTKKLAIWNGRRGKKVEVISYSKGTDKKGATFFAIYRGKVYC